MGFIWNLIKNTLYVYNNDNFNSRTYSTFSSLQRAARKAHPDHDAYFSPAPPPPPATPAKLAWGQSCCCARALDSQIYKLYFGKALPRQVILSLPMLCRHPLESHLLIKVKKREMSCFYLFLKEIAFFSQLNEQNMWESCRRCNKRSTKADFEYF